MKQEQHSRGELRPRLRRVSWLAELLDISQQQTYEAISTGQVPKHCIARIGRRIRVIEENVIAWLSDSEQAAVTPQ